ncbi:MAG: hypothetical protein OER85_13735 [Gammaproteobacteria bacterium]|nr:hypothetical protein [Gammaproteobacteria bacterium]
MTNQWNIGRRSLGCSILYLLLGFFVVGGAATANDDANSLVNSPGVYTLVNLHPDQENNRLYSVNYQLPFLIPVCTEVKITKLKKKRMTFEIVETGREYEYNWHKKANPGGLNENILLFFGRECPAEEIKTLSEIDQKGIKSGRVSEGMTRRGVIIAMGYPPPHVTPDLEMDEWMYWMNRFNRTAVVFGEDGTVEMLRK